MYCVLPIIPVLCLDDSAESRTKKLVLKNCITTMPYLSNYSFYISLDLRSMLRENVILYLDEQFSYFISRRRD